MIRRWLPAVTGRTALLTALWWAAAEGRPLTWYLAAPAVLLAVLASLALRPPARWSPVGFVRFAAFFVAWSIRGGLDVAWRAVRPGPPLRPGFRSFGLHVRHPQTQLVVTRTMSLLPGTLGVRLHGDRLTLHLLDVDLPNERLLRRCERRVAGLHRSEQIEGSR